MTQIKIKQSPLSGIAQALTQGLQGYRQGQSSGRQIYQQNQAFNRAEEKAEQDSIKFENDQADRKRRLELQGNLSGDLTRLNAYNSGAEVPLSGPSNNLVSRRGVPSLEDYSGAQANILQSFDAKNAKGIAEALGLYQDQAQSGQGVSAAQDGNLGLADALLSAAGGETLPNRYSTNAQGVQTNGLTGDTSIGAEGLYDSLIAGNYATAANQGASANRTNARIQPEIDLLGAQAGSANRANLDRGTTLQRNFEAAGIPTTDPRFTDAVTKQGSTNINIENQNFDPSELNETQGKSYLFGSRMQSSGDIINELQGGIAGKGFVDSVGQLVDEKIVGSTVGNQFTDQDFQKYDQAKRDFVNAVLRRESGAVITPQEFENAEKQYFPVPGNSPEVLAQKQRNRELATKLLLDLSGAPELLQDQNINTPIDSVNAPDDPLGIR